MNLRTITLVPPTGAGLVLGAVTYAGGVPSGYTLETMRMDPGDRALTVAPLPLVPGGLVVPGRQGAREIELGGTIVAGSAISARTLRRNLINVLRDRGESGVLVQWSPDGSVVELTGYLDGAVECESAQGSHFLTYRFRLVCPDPVALSTVEASASLSGVPGVTVVNGGTATTWPEFTLTLAGTVDNLRIGNTTTGEYLQLNGLPGGATLQVVTRPGFESITRGGSVLDKLDVLSRWPSLPPGSSQFYVTVTAGGGSASGVVRYRSGWVD